MTEKQKQLYGIAIFTQEIVLTDYSNNVEQRYLVNREQLMRFFLSDIKVSTFPGLLWMKLGQNQSYLVQLPAGKRDIMHCTWKKNAEHVTTIPMRLPKLIVKATLKEDKKKIQNISIWCHFDKELTPETQLYEVPLPNIHGPSMCLGSTAHTVEEGKITEAIEIALFQTQFTHHSHIVGNESLPFETYAKKYRGNCPQTTLNTLCLAKEVL